jgi:Ser-tRNA(Ala) deacylase AlaX
MTAQEKFRTTRLLYYEDAYLKEFTAKVSATQATDGQEEIVLDQTTFYPLGGGQPPDTGKIKGAKGEAAVTDVHMEKGAVIHVAHVEGTITEGETVTGVIDWNRRYALMRNHTLAHLMAEAIRKATGLPSEVVSSGLDVDKARLDFAHSGSLGPFLPDIQKVADEVIRENRPVEIKIMQRKEAEEYVTRFHESLKTLPPHVETVRIVEVRDWHACACGGIHVRKTGEIWRTEILRRMSKGKGIERIEFRAKTY